MENKTSEFVKNNDHIVPKPTGVDYDLIPGNIYSLQQDKWGDFLYLKEDKIFEFPEQYYMSDADKRFINKTINTFNATKKLTTGVLLSGTKGAGKTLMAKHIAKESKLPVIVIDPRVTTREIEGFFAKFTTDVCVLFDEIDKYWNSRDLLGFLDGVKPSCKKLVLCTCNDENEIDDYLNDRCSRIRYKRTFECLTKEAVRGIMDNMISDKKKAKSATEFVCSRIQVVSYDNVIMFAEEIINNPEDTFETIVADMNIACK